MCLEMEKATARRKHYISFAIYFSGVGLDIGCGDCAMDAFAFRGTIRVDGFDRDNATICGNAETLANINSNTYDFVVSSHCLEHMVDPKMSLRNWIRVVKPGGYLVITVPEWEMYERRQWPSRFNGDHKWAWCTTDVSAGHIINVHKFLEDFLDEVSVIKVEEIVVGFDYNLPRNIDQTATPAECCIEFILQKKREQDGTDKERD